MKFLIVDHFFSQDIEALQYVAAEHELRIVSATLLRNVARKFFPFSVFASLLGEDYALPEYAQARQRYAVEACKILRSLYYTFPFDAVIIPSDAIFYLRAWVPAAHQMGIPVIVLQKETAYSPYSMIEDARVIGESIPLISDLMLVCSEHNKQFWLNAGVDARKIIVNGQPRFDFYRRPERWKTLDSLGVHVQPHLPTLLFFSYDLGAYAPEGVLAPVWTQLRSETEEVLVDLARQGRFNLLIKPHPQQQGIQEDQERLSAMAGAAWGKTVQLLPGGLDTRQLIVNTQIVVGFQTTAMFEAMAAGKIVIYTFWTEATHRLCNDLLPFHEMGDALLIARSAQELVAHLLSDQGTSMIDAQVFRRWREIEKELGTLDGQASERCWKIMETFIRKYMRQVDVDAVLLRRSLDDQAPIYCRQALPVAWLAVGFWSVVEWLLPAMYPIWLAVRWLLGKRGPASTHRRVVELRCAAEEKAVYCRAVLSDAVR
ncbi:MAG: hypothetical protein NT118_01600 [Lentisphaerae bacterium]|nr:hypothetical protein [Lentisphaerota bacterium]